MAQSILIPASVSEAVCKRLNRIAAKAGITLDQVKGYTKLYRKAAHTITPKDGPSYQVLKVDTTQVLECIRVTVSDMPRFNGHTFVGKVSHIKLSDGTVGNTLCLSPLEREAEIPADWRTGKPTCDHCNTRRDRKDTFLIRRPDGQIVKIGRNCLADFLMADPSQMVALSEFEDSLRELSEADPDGDFFGCGRPSYGIDPFHYLACAVSVVDKLGFVKRSGSDDRREPTANVAERIAQPFRPYGGNVDEKFAEWTALQPTDEHRMTAVAICLWLDSELNQSDYIHNLQMGLQAAVAEPRVQGLLASAPTAYARAMGALAERQAKAARPDAGHVAAVGKRVDLQVTITAVRTIDSLYGSKDIVSFRTVEGHDCVTFTTGSTTPRSSDVGKVWTVRGTVKEHGEYQGRKQTVFSRCSWTRPAE